MRNVIEIKIFFSFLNALAMKGNVKELER